MQSEYFGDYHSRLGFSPILQLCCDHSQILNRNSSIQWIEKKAEASYKLLRSYVRCNISEKQLNRADSLYVVLCARTKHEWLWTITYTHTYKFINSKHNWLRHFYSFVFLSELAKSFKVGYFYAIRVRQLYEMVEVIVYTFVLIFVLNDAIGRNCL